MTNTLGRISTVLCGQQFMDIKRVRLSPSMGINGNTTPGEHRGFRQRSLLMDLLNARITHPAR